MGLTIAYHFCGESLVSTSFVFNEETQEPVGCCDHEPADCCAEEPVVKCRHEQMDDTCCSDQVVNLKLKDSHFAAAKINLDNLSLDFILIPIDFDENNYFAKSISTLTTISHSPPETPVYILNRTLLI